MEKSEKRSFYDYLPVFSNAKRIDRIRILLAFLLSFLFLLFDSYQLVQNGDAFFQILLILTFFLTIFLAFIPYSLPLRLFTCSLPLLHALFSPGAISFLPIALFIPILLIDLISERKILFFTWLTLFLFFTGFDIWNLILDFQSYFLNALSHLTLYVSSIFLYFFLWDYLKFHIQTFEREQQNFQQAIQNLQSRLRESESQLEQKNQELQALTEKEFQLETQLQKYQQEGIMLSDVVEELEYEKQQLTLQRQKEWFREQLLHSIQWTPGQTLREWAQETLQGLHQNLKFHYAALFARYIEDQKWTPVASFGVPLPSSQQITSNGLFYTASTLKQYQLFYNEDSIQAHSTAFTLHVPVLIVLPLVFANETIGIVFLGFQEKPDAFLEVIDDFQQRFSNILQSILQQEYIQQLLHISQEKTEELLAQEEELRQNLEELHATQEQLRQTQQEITRQRNQLRAVFHTIDSVVIACDENKEITLFNPRAQQLFPHLSERENIASILSVDPRLSTLLERSMTTQSLQSDTIAFKERQWEVKIAPILGQNGELKGACLVMNDITELKRQERRIRYLVNNLPGAAYTIQVTPDNQFHVHFISNPVVEITGYLARDFKRSHITFPALLHPEEKDHVLKTIQEAIKQNLSFQLEHRILTKVGQTKWVLHKGKPYMENDLVFIDGFLLDITERVEKGRQLEELMQSLEDKVKERTRQLEESYAELAALKEQLLHSEKFAVLGQLFSGIAHEIKTPLGAIISSNQNIHDIFPSFITLYPKTSRRMTEDQFQRFLAFITYLLENQQFLSSREARKIRKELTAELEKAGVENADLIARRLLSAGYPHATLGEYLPLFQDEIGTDASEACFLLGQIYMNLHNISVAGEKTRKILDALKRYSHGGITDHPEPTNVKETIETILVLYSHQLKYNVQLETHFDESVPEILGYPDELGQVWTNLIMNALDAMKNEGKLEISLEQDDQYVIVKVTDSGPGIPPDIQESIFKPFFTTKERGKGTGLGLHLCKQIVEKHGGKIEVDSEPGRTTFTVYLPKTKPEQN